jgi:hypothetical protein
MAPPANANLSITLYAGLSSADSIWTRGENPVVPYAWARSDTAVETPACKQTILTFEDVRAGLSKQADTELVQTGITAEAHSGDPSSGNKQRVSSCASPMLARLLDKKLFLQDWAAALRASANL